MDTDWAYDLADKLAHEWNMKYDSFTPEPDLAEAFRKIAREKKAEGMREAAERVVATIYKTDNQEFRTMRLRLARPAHSVDFAKSAKADLLARATQIEGGE
jgi:hypothetical protein